jgi:hypothetical protein
LMSACTLAFKSNGRYSASGFISYQFWYSSGST